MNPTIKIATRDDIPKIADFLLAMQDELADLPLGDVNVLTAITENFDKVVWFLFYDENNTPFGTVFAEEQFAYFMNEKRFSLGGMYIVPDFRGKGYFKKLMKQVEDWLYEHRNCRFINIRINEKNKTSHNAYSGIGYTESTFKNHTKRIKGN